MPTKGLPVRETAKRVLLVEDDPDTARLVRGYLREASFYVRHAARLDAALKYLSEEPFDAVVTDLSLPDSRGVETFSKIGERFPDIPFVVLTASHDESLGVTALRQGAQDFVFKDELEPHLLPRSLLYAIERHRLRTSLRDLAFRDPLTGLYNRRGLEALAEHQLTLARRESRSLVVVAIDIDHFKKINDVYGHDEGDRALVRVAGVLRRTFRGPDVLARAGGDEFIVIATGSRHADAIALIAARLRAQLKYSNRAHGSPYDLSVSIGVSTLIPEAATKVNEVLRAADRAMYDDKRSQRGHGRRLTGGSSAARSRQSDQRGAGRRGGRASDGNR